MTAATASAVPAAPTDAELRTALEGSRLGTTAPDASRTWRLRRHPFAYATSSAIEEVTVEFDDGTSVDLLLKHLSPDRRQQAAGGVRPVHVQDPLRELATYRSTVGPEGIGPRCHAAVTDARHGQHWIVIEKVPGVPLWQIGDIATWTEVARWTARFHRRFAGRHEQLRADNRHLAEYGGAAFRGWAHRAVALCEGEVDPGAQQALEQVCTRYEYVVERLCALPTTLVHGELYPANVIVDGAGDDLRVCPVDWEMAGLGPGLLDLAALSSGWDRGVQARLTAAYLTERGVAAAVGDGDVDEAVDCARLHYALQWLGWSRGWHAPAEHRHDWLAEALTIAARLGLVDEVRP